MSRQRFDIARKQNRNCSRRPIILRMSPVHSGKFLGHLALQRLSTRCQIYQGVSASCTEPRTCPARLL
eukprot:6213410-Pleurochrysis_carterae.AAC.1